MIAMIGMRDSKILSILLFIFISWVASCATVSANESLFYKETNFIGGYSNRDHWVGKSNDLTNALGFEDYRKFSNDYGDYLTTDLQIRLAYDSMQNSHNA